VEHDTWFSAKVRAAQADPRPAISAADWDATCAGKLTDPNFPRRRGRVPGTLELVVHPNYVVILEQALDAVTVLEVLHSALKYP
jgi:plasmid stabilization system protein ParE